MSVLTKLTRKQVNDYSNSIGSLSILVNNNSNATSRRTFKIAAIGKHLPKEQHWNYRFKRYGLWGQLVDPSAKRLLENSLLISVEGNFGSGKSKFAADLAKAIQFKHANTPDIEKHLYTLDNGNSMRDIMNEIVGENQRFRLDRLDEWHLKPTFKRSIAMQMNLYRVKWFQFRLATLHLLSTGQGVVTERSPFSDQVIAQALNGGNFFSPEAYAFYNSEYFPNTIISLWKPHLVIYVNRSPDDCLKNIKRNGQPFEKESKVYSLDLLNRVENNYRNYLSYIERFAHVLEYDSDNVDMERVLEDIELLDFNAQNKFQQWAPRKEYHLDLYRSRLANKTLCNAWFDKTRGWQTVKEIVKHGQEVNDLQAILAQSPKTKSAEYNKLVGIKGLFALGNQAPIEKDLFA